jgi:hypothetical protein
VFVIALAIWAYIALFTPKIVLQEVGSSGNGSVSQPGASDLSVYKTDPKWIWWNEQSARDPQFEWKMPISFYGKVVDESEHPLPKQPLR